MNESEVLNNAADLILERGHNHGAYVGENGSVCAIGAIRIACGASTTPRPHNDGFLLSGGTFDHDAAGDSEYVLRYFLIGHPSYKFHQFESLPSWNDNNDEVTVVAALKAAAEWAKDRSNCA